MESNINFLFCFFFIASKKSSRFFPNFLNVSLQVDKLIQSNKVDQQSESVIFAYSLSIYQMVQTQKIKIFRAILKRDLRTFSDMITYAQIQIGGITKKTMPDFKGGKKPTWNQIFQFKTSTTQAKITIYDQGKLSDELVGDANFDIKSLAQQKEEVIDVMFEGKVIGKIFIKILPTVLIVQPKEDNLLSSPMPKPPLSQTDRKTLQNAACNLLGKKIADNMLQQQNRQTPLKTTQKAPEIYPQQQMLAPLPQFYPPQAHIPQQIPMGPQAQMSPPVYYQHQQSMSPPRYNPPPQFVQPFTNSMNNVFQAPPGQIQHNFMIPSNMIMQSPVRSNQFGKISQENYNVAYNRVQNQRSINPFKDLTDLLL